MQRAKLKNVEMLRGIAATLVVFYHADKYYYGVPSLWPTKILGGLFAFGYAGVEFFFVLSGFIIATVHAADGGRPAIIPSFIRKRFVRIYPFYWCCLAVTVLGMVAVPGVASRIDAAALVGSFALAGIEPLRSVLFVAWTLFYEVVFYAIFCLYLWNRRAGLIMIPLWAIAGLVLRDYNHHEFYLLSPLNTLFLVGIGCAAALKRWTIPMPIVLAVLGSTLFLFAGAYDALVDHLSTTKAVALFGPASAIALMGFVEMERSGIAQVRGLPVVIGQASYSIYLTHMFIVTLISKACRQFHLSDVLPGELAFIVFATVAVAAGIGIHFAVEKPVMRWTGRGLARARDWRSSMASSRATQ